MGMRERRIHHRVRVLLPTLVRARGQMLMAQTENLSVGGVRIALDSPLLENSSVTVSIRNAKRSPKGTEEEIFFATGEVVWCIEDDEAGFLAGIQFTSIEGDGRERLELFIDTFQQ